MAKSIGLTAGGGARRNRAWNEAWAALRRRLFETLGFSLLLAALLIAAALVSYDPRDPSLDTAIDAGPHNFLGQDGAMLADLLRQSLGFAGFVIPLVLAGWSLRLLLDRPLLSPWLKLGLLPAALLLAALALSVLDHGADSGALVGYGGALGWEMQRALALAGLGAAALPVSMIAAAGLGLLLLLILGLSWRDWRELGGGAGRGAGRFAVLSGHGTMLAAGVGGKLLRRWWRARPRTCLRASGCSTSTPEPRSARTASRWPTRCASAPRTGRSRRPRPPTPATRPWPRRSAGSARSCAAADGRHRCQAGRLPPTQPRTAWSVANERNCRSGCDYRRPQLALSRRTT